MTMEEIQNPTSCDSLTFRSHKVFEMKVSHENRKGIDHISVADEIGTENQNGLSDLGGARENELLDSVSFETHDKDQNSVTAEELDTPCIGIEHVVSISSPCDVASDLLETVTNEFTDKNVLSCELPELEVMKDICVDNEMLEIKEEKDGKSVDQERLISSSVSSSEKDIDENCDLLEQEQAAIKSLEEDSPVDKKHPVKEPVDLVLLGSFPDSSNDEGKELLPPTDQIEAGSCNSLIQTFPIEIAVSVDPDTSSPEVREVEDNVLDGGSLPFKRNVESRSIAFDFLDIGHNSSIVDPDEQPDDSSANSNVQSVSSEKQHVVGNSDDFSSDGQTLSPSNDDAPVVCPKFQYDHGETSFSAVTYSDPVSLSRSLSHRSDASTTSVRSFAFPVLQSEWNSSPVRMAKADRRHFRKQKGWRSGLLCCRF